MKKTVIVFSIDNIGKAMQTMVDFMKNLSVKKMTVLGERTIESKPPKRGRSGNITYYPPKTAMEQIELRMKPNPRPKTTLPDCPALVSPRKRK